MLLAGGTMWGQTTIFTNAGGGSAPTGWSFTNNVVAEPVDKTSYWLVEAGTTSDIITTATYDLSAYASATFSANITSFGSGSHNALKVEVSYDGVTYTQTSTTPITTTNYVTQNIALSQVSSTVKIRLSVNATSGRGIRLQQVKLVATGSAGPSLSTNVTSLTAFASTNVGAQSASSSFTVSGALLTANAVVTAPSTDFQVSLNNTDFSSSVNIPFGTGTLTNVPVYVRFTPQSGGAKSGDVAISSTGATSKTVGVSGTGVGPSATLSGTLNEATLNGGSFTITLANDTFTVNPLSMAAFTLNNAPSGVTIAGVNYIDATTATVALAYNNTDFDSNVTTLNVTIAGSQLASASQLISGNITITAVAESLVSANDLAFGNVCINTTSDSNFTITGTVKAGTIQLTAAPGYTFSLTNGGTYTSTLSFVASAGALNQVIYVRFSPIAVEAYVASTTVSGGSASTNLIKNFTGSGINTQATVLTNAATSLLATGATLSGRVSVVGICPASTERGFVYSATSVNAAPAVDGTGVTKVVVAGMNTTTYTQAVTGLTALTGYTVRAYAYNGLTYTYGSAVTFTTAPSNDLCANAIALTVGNTAVTGTLANASYTSMTNGDSADDVWYSFVPLCTGSHIITVTVPNGDTSEVDVRLYSGSCPSNNNSHIAVAASYNNPEVITTSLTSGTTYYVRVFDGDITDNTTFTIGVVSASQAPTLTAGAASGIVYDGASVSATATITTCSAAITAYGVEYSTTNGFANGTGTPVAGSNLAGTAFSVGLSGLNQNTTYYYKSYATNATGTGYSTQGSFTTSAYVIAAPVATAATFILGDSFTANWNAEPDAETYRLDVSTHSNFATGAEGTTATENFSNITTGQTNYATRNWTGVGGISWIATLARTDQTLTGAAITLQNNSSASLESGSISGGVSNIKFDVKDAFSGSGVLTIKVLHGASFAIVTTIGTMNYNSSTNSYDSGVINISGDYKIRLENNNAGRPIIDNLAYTTLSTLVPSFVAGYSNLQVSGTSHVVTGLAPETTYYYRVRSENASPSAVSVNSNTINATTLVENVWDGEVWSEGTPPSDLDVAVIEGDYNTAPSADGIFGSNTLIIESGNFVVAEGTTLTVQNQIINNGAAANFIVENGASLIQVNDVDNTGDFTVQKDSNPLYKLDYTVWSSPVTGQVLQDFSPLTLPNRFYTYGIDTDNEEAYISTSSAGTFQPGIGYLIRMPDHLPAEHPDYDGYELGASGAEGALPYTLEGEYAGNLINGDVPVALSTQDQFYSMVGNPYASPISVEEFFTENAGVLHGDAGIYFWRKRNSQAATSYAALTTTSYAANDGGVESGDDPGTYSNGGQQWEDYYENTSPSEWVIAPGQGFFVRGNGAAGNLMFTNGMRRNAGTGQPFFRMNQPQLSRLWLNLYSETNFSQTSIAYAEGATLGVDYGKDARRFASPNLSLYSVVGEDSFTIQSRPAFEDTDVVPMGYNVNTAGTYTIALHRKDGVFEDGQNVYLKDTQLDIIHDFSGGIYTFATEAGTFNERFRVIYSDGALGVNNPVANNNTVVVYNKENVLNVNSGNIQITAITVYDLRGRVLYTATDINSAEAVINMQPQQQVLLVEVNTATGKVTKKVVY
jgi:sulfur relay (sulfurtransferase) complex TusBCD TusD component (DsrE family)